jgi:arylsulfatase A-like enzyme
MIKINPFILIATVIIITTGCSQKNKSTESKKPNIIIVLADDAGYADFGAYGGKEIPTPNIDALIASGVKFTNAYVSASVCAPSRAGLLTGRYQQRFGFENNMSGDPTEGFTKEDMGIDPKENTFGDEMRGNGYRTLAIGKWHLGNQDKHFPLNRGFDEFYGFVGGHRSFFSIKTGITAEEVIHDNKKIVSENSVTYLTDMWTDKAISYIKQKSDKPFFIYLAYNAVHTPVDAKKNIGINFHPSQIVEEDLMQH